MKLRGLYYKFEFLSRTFLEFVEIFYPSLTHVPAIPLDTVGKNTAVTLLNTATCPCTIYALVNPHEHDIITHIVLLTSGSQSIPQTRSDFHHVDYLIAKSCEVIVVENVALEDVFTNDVVHVLSVFCCSEGIIH